MAVEEAGRKGRGGSALRHRPQLGAFFVTTCRDLAERGALRTGCHFISGLLCGGRVRPAAASVRCRSVGTVRLGAAALVLLVASLAAFYTRFERRNRGSPYWRHAGFRGASKADAVASTAEFRSRQLYASLPWMESESYARSADRTVEYALAPRWTDGPAACPWAQIAVNAGPKRR